MSYNPFALNYHYKADPAKEIVKLTMTKGSLLKCLAPTLILFAVSAGLTAYNAFTENTMTEYEDPEPDKNNVRKI